MSPISEARARANAAHIAKLREGGMRSVTFRATPAMLARLDELKARHGSLQAAMAWLLSQP